MALEVVPVMLCWCAPSASRQWSVSLTSSEGNELVDWLVAEKLALGPVEAVAVGQELVKLGVFHHVTKDHAFKNEKLFYTFTVCASTAIPRWRKTPSTNAAIEYGRDPKESAVGRVCEARGPQYPSTSE